MERPKINCGKSGILYDREIYYNQVEPTMAFFESIIAFYLPFFNLPWAELSFAAIVEVVTLVTVVTFAISSWFTIPYILLRVTWETFKFACEVVPEKLVEFKRRYYL
jgi:hypothetical protein